MIYAFTECELDTARHELRRLGSPCHLEPQVFDVLTYLVRNRDRLVGMVVAGWARCAETGLEQGLAEMLEGLEAHRQTGAAMERPYLLSLLADAYRVCSRPREGLAVLEEALALLAGGRGFFYQAEMLRLKAELMLQAGHPPEGAEAQLRDASRIAREQNARSAELRIALSLARLWEARGEIEQAKRLVGAARSGVEEGQDTPDAREAEQFVRQPGLPG